MVLFYCLLLYQTMKGYFAVRPWAQGPSKWISATRWHVISALLRNDDYNSQFLSQL